MDNGNQTPEERKAERQRRMKMQRYMRLGAILLALLIAIISLAVSCSTRNAVSDLAAQISAKKAAQEAQAQLAAQQAANTVPVATNEGSSAESDISTTITMSFVGDCTLASYEGAAYAGSFEQYYDENGEDYFFQNVKSIFEGDDLTVANFEGTLTNTTASRTDKQWTFKSDPSYVGILTAGGIDAVNVANNHSADYGDESYVDTLANLDNAGILRFGGTYTETTEINGVTIGFSGIYECEEGIGCMEQAVKNVTELQDKGADIIICEFHWGDENSYTPSDIHTQLAHAVIDAGADLVIGHHPHVLQGIELYKGKYICYSMGNFCFGGNSNPSDQDTMIFQQTFTLVDGKLQDNAAYSIIPCTISSDTTCNNYQPTPAVGEEGERIIEKIYGLCDSLDGGIVRPDTSDGSEASDTEDAA